MIAILLSSYCVPISAQEITCDARPAERRIDGSCNNISSLEHSQYGKAGITLRRVIADHYSDGIGALAGLHRPNPRHISNVVIDQPGLLVSKDGLSSLTFTWAQFLDHDIDLSPETEEHADVPLPDNEPDFIRPIPFKRSQFAAETGQVNPREQLNVITAWIDGSNVYGSDHHRADWLRTFSNGKLKTSSGNLLPFNTLTGEFDSAIDPNAPEMGGDRDGTVKTYVAGDVRAAEQPGLTSLHTIFVREHNRLCDEMLGQGLSDEEIYQRAKRRVSGIMQNITYSQFLPALGINLGSYRGYFPAVNPNIMNIFSTAAYRLGHTMVIPELPLVNDNCEKAGSISLFEAFFNPQLIQQQGIDNIIKGLSATKQMEVDPFVVDDLRKFLFPIPGSPAPFELDLATLNIQRGRDHGLPDYNTVRQFFIGSLLTSIDQITPDPEIRRRLKEAYNDDINNIDPWVGMLAEKHLSGKSIGPTLNAILSTQFGNLRNGDFYYFENDPANSANEVLDISKTTLRDVLMRNTGLNFSNDNVFRVDPTCEVYLEAECELVVNAGSDFSICKDDGPVQITTSVIGGVEPYIYNWLHIEGDNNPTSITEAPVVTTIYVVEVTDAQQCKSTAEVIVTIVDEGELDISHPAHLCVGEVGELKINNPFYGTTYDWDLEGAYQLISANSDSTELMVKWMGPADAYNIRVMATTPEGCQQNQFSSITITGELVLATPDNQSICIGQDLKLIGNGSSFANFSWTVLSGDFNSIIVGRTTNHPTVRPSESTVYEMRVYDPIYACESRDTVAVMIDQSLAPIADAGMDTKVCLGEELILGGNKTGSNPDGSTSELLYQWSPYDGLLNPAYAFTSNPEITAAIETDYTVIVSSLVTGCSDTSSMTLMLFEAGEPGFDCEESLTVSVMDRTASVRGSSRQVKTLDDQPMSGIELSLYRDTNNDGVGDEFIDYANITKEDGTADYFGLDDGHYMISITSRNFEEGQLLEGYIAKSSYYSFDVEHGLLSNLFTVEVDAVANVEFVLEKSKSLAVQLSSFEVSKIKNADHIDIQWSAYEDIQHSHYILERSNNPSNGFKNIQKSLSKGANGLKAYDYQDFDLDESLRLYYRLKMVDRDGLFEYSDIQSVKLENNGLATVTVYPNPSTGLFLIRFDSAHDGVVELSIFDNVGRLIVPCVKMKITDGVGEIPMDLSEYSVGTYSLRLRDNKKVYIQRLVVTK